MALKVKVANWIYLAIIMIAVVVGGGLILALSQKVDMTGGKYIVYQIDDTELEPNELEDLINKTINVLRKRIDPKNVLRLAWIPRNNACFEVQIPLPGESVKRKYEAYREAVAQLEERNMSPDDAMGYYILDDIPEEIERDQTKYDAIKEYFSALDKYIAYLGIYDPAKNNFNPHYIKQKIAQTGYLDFRIVPTLEHPDTSKIQIERYIELLKAKGPREASDESFVWCEIKDRDKWHSIPFIIESYEDKYYLLASNALDECMLHGLKANWKIDQVSGTTDRMGRPAVNFTLDKDGGDILAALTGKNIDRPLCILLDNVALTAPLIQSRIRRDVMITGAFTAMEINEIVDYLDAGTLSVTILKTPVSEGVIGNKDSTEKNKRW